MHYAKVLFERYFLRKVRKGVSELVFKRHLLKLLGIERLQKATRLNDAA